MMILQAEVIHARWAMLGTLGIMRPELLASYSGGETGQAAAFKEVGPLFVSSGLDYWAYAGLIQSLPLVTIIGYQVLLRGALEAYLKIYPWYSPLDDGGYFDPMGLYVSPDVLTFSYVQEVKRGRIAMFGMLGYHLQAHIVGGVSPDIWAAQVADPYGAHGLLHYEQFLPTPLVAFSGFKNINKWLAPKLPTFTTVPLPTLLAPRY